MAGTPNVIRGIQDTFGPAAAGFEVDIADTLDAIDPRDLPLLSLLGWPKVAPKEKGAAKGADTLSNKCTQTTHTWLNDELKPNTFVLTAAYTAGDPTITIGTTTVEYVNVHDRLMIGGAHFRVTAVDTGAGTVSIALLPGATDAAAANGATVRRLGNANVEAKVAEIGGEVPDPTQTSNYTQNIDDRVTISGTAIEVARYGIKDNQAHSIAHMIQSKMLEFEQMAVYNLRVANPSSNTQPARQFGGLWQFIRLGTMNQTDQIINAASARLTEAHFERMPRAIFLAGGGADTILVPPVQKSIIDDWNLPYSRLEGFSEERYGGIVSRYRNSFGEYQIVIDRHLNDSDIIFLTKKFIGIGPLGSRSFKIELLPKGGDYVQWYMHGEYTMEVRNNTRAHGWIHTLATS